MQKIQKTLPSQQAIHDWVLRRGKLKNKKIFLIQEGIDLAHCHNRPFDIRAVVQLNAWKRWEISGMSAKVAGLNLAVTNVARGGEIMEVTTCLAEGGYSSRESYKRINEIGDLAFKVARHLGKSYDNAIYGLDIGLDQAGRLWLIEVNTQPSLELFKNNPEHPMNVRTNKLYQLNVGINKNLK